jgi:hypothetical protein
MTCATFPTPRSQDSYERRNWKTIAKIVETGGDKTLPTMLKYEAKKGLQSSPVGSLANLIPLQESVRRLLTIVTSGPRLPVSFARFDRDGSSGRMFAVSSTPNLDGSSAAFSGTWPTWGIALDGACGELPTLERCTSANESSSSPTWQTPVADDSVERTAGKFNSRGEPKLSAQVKQWPTPTARDWRSESCTPEVKAERDAHPRGKSLPWEIGGSLNPTWVEGLMGFPPGWTEV